MRVDARSVIHVHVVGEASIANAVEQNTSRDCRWSPGLQQACGRLHNTFLAQQRLSCQHVPQSTRNAAAQKYLYNVNDAHVAFECVGVRQKLAADAGSTQ